MPLSKNAKLLNTFTMIGIVLGFIAIALFILLELFVVGSLLLVMSAIIDRYDGKLARTYNIANEFGKVMDGFNDLISFILAPVILIYQLNMMQSLVVCMLGTVIYIIAGIFRLARFAVDDQNDTIQGLPTTLSGILLIIVVNFIYISTMVVSQWIVFSILVLLSLLMVSSFRAKKL